MRRLALPIAVLAFASACARAPSGPAVPIAQEQIDPASGLDAAAARAAAVSFLDAYARSGSGGVKELRSLVIGRALRSWVRWLGVQNGEFDGSIRGVTDVRSAAFVGTVPLGPTFGALVDVRASVSFSYAPVGDAPFKRTVDFDGPMSLVNTAPAEWKVADATRDGASMDSAIVPFAHATRRIGPVAVRLDSLFRFSPWEFNVVVTNHGPGSVHLDPGAALLVQQPSGVLGVNVVPTPSLVEISAGSQVDGLVVTTPQDSTAGRTLVLPYRTNGGRVMRFAFRITAPAGPSPAPPTAAASSPAEG